MKASSAILPSWKKVMGDPNLTLLLLSKLSVLLVLPLEYREMDSEFVLLLCVPNFSAAVDNSVLEDRCMLLLSDEGKETPSNSMGIGYNLILEITIKMASLIIYTLFLIL
jgi:hypothetical protein